MSALFDEWTYQEMYKVSPETSPQESETEVPSISLVEEPPTVEIPAPEIRQRATTFCGTPQPKRYEYPTGSAEYPPLNTSPPSLDTWLGNVHPQKFEFNEQLWQAQIREFEKSQLDMELSSTVCRNLTQELKFLNQESAWIQQELYDIQTHDLNPLLKHTATLDELAIKKSMINDIRKAHHIGWGAYSQVQKLLHQPPKRIVPNLLSIMSDIQNGVQFCQQHPDYVDIAQMELAWRNSAQRALQITASYCVHELKQIFAKIVDQCKQNPNLTSTLLYTKFKSDVDHLAPLVKVVLEFSKHDQQQNKWVLDLQNSYFSLRSSLIQPLVNSFVAKIYEHNSLDDKFNDTVRSTLLQFKELYESEYRVFISLFSESTPEFWMFLRDMSDSLYASVRKLIVRETDIAKLCKLTFLIQSHNEGDVDNDDGDVTDDNSLNEVHDDYFVKKQEQAHLEDPFEVLYQDAQKRLVFRAGMLIDSFAKYKPNPKDFTKDQFPVVSQTLDLLGQVYQLLNSKVFNDLAQRSIRECLVSLDQAVSTHPESKNFKIHLFHVKQLLILQSKIVDFDLENVYVQDVDFGGIIRLLRMPRGRSFREMLSMAWESVPHVVEVMLDAMEETYASFRMAVDRLCSSFTNELMPSLMKKSESIADNNTEFRNLSVVKFKELKTEVGNLIPDSTIADVLLDAAQDKVLDEYTLYYRELPLGVAATEGVMDIDTMAVWLSDAISSR